MIWYEMIVGRWLGWRWIVCDFNIQYFILIWRFLMKLNDVFYLCLYSNHIIFLIVTCYLLFVLVFVWISLDIDICIRISVRRFVDVTFDMIWYDMIWYDITHNDMIFECQYVWRETVVSTYLSSNTIIGLIQSSSLLS